MWYVLCPIPGIGAGMRQAWTWVRSGEVKAPKKAQRELPAGIVIRGAEETEQKPVISAFIWGGKVRPEPTLPFGRWKPTAA